MRGFIAKRIKRGLVWLLIVGILISAGGCGWEELLNEILPDYVTVNLDNAALLSETDETGAQVCTFELRAMVTNNFTADVKSLEVCLSVPDTVKVTDAGEKAVAEKVDLVKGDSKNYSWTVKIPKTYENQNIDYSIKASSTGIKSIEAYGSIFVRGKSTTDNRLNDPSDMWKFKNFSSKPVHLTQEDYNALIVGLNNSSVKLLQDMIADGAGGYCYGFAVSSILSKVGALKPSDIGSSWQTIHDIPKNHTAQSLLAYYWITQVFTCIQNEKAAFAQKSAVDRIRILEEETKKVESGAPPVLVCYQLVQDGKEGGHAVVAYAQESGKFKKRNKDYTTRILIYDSNFPERNEDAFIYYNAQTGEWDVPYWPKVTELSMVLADINVMNVKDLMDNRKSANSYLTVKNSENFTITDTAGTVLATVNGTSVDGSNEIVAYRMDGRDDEIVVAIPNSAGEKGVVVRASGDAAYQVLMRCDDYYMTADAGSGNSVALDPNGTVKINGAASDFRISVTADEGHYSSAWHTVEITGKAGDDPQLALSADGYLVSGAHLQKLQVYAEGKTTAGKLKMRTVDGSVLVTQDGEKLCVKSDGDSDGRYETVLGVGRKTKPTDPLSGTAAFRWWLIPVILGGAVALAGLGFLAIRLFGGRRTRKPMRKSGKSGNHSEDEWWM